MPLAQRPDVGSRSNLRLDNLVMLGFLYLGLEVSLMGRLSIDAGPISLGLVVGAVLAVFGWRRSDVIFSGRAYIGWAGFLTVWVMVSGVAAWSGESLSESAAMGAWIAFIIPGLASLLFDERLLNALVLGLAVGAAVYITVAAVRLVSGAAVLDVVDGRSTGQLLGDNRNGVNLLVLLVVPFALGNVGPQVLRRVRWPFIVLAALWLVYSGGRSGLAGLAVVLLVFGLLQPTVGRRVRVLLLTALVGALAFAWVQGTTGESTVSTERLIDVIQGERTPEDEARGLLLRKAVYLAGDHPVFGVGAGNFEGTYSPVVEDASSVSVRTIAVEYTAHNTFAEVLAELGWPGAVAFAGLFVMLLREGIRRRSDARVRVASVALSGMMFAIFFHSALGASLFYATAILLGAILHVDHERADTAEAACS